MAAIHHYREALGALVPFDVEMEASIRAGELGLAVDAVLGSAATCGVVVDDADGALAILGKQQWQVEEDAAPAEATLTGTVAKTSGDVTLVGTGTAFDDELAEGDELVVDGEYLFVQTVTDATHVDVWAAPAASASGLAVTRAGRRRMWSGRTSTKRITRGRHRTEGGEIEAAGRAWSIDLVEWQGYLHSRIPVTSGAGGSDNWNRPAETLADRLAFIVGSTLFADLGIFDDGFVVYPTFDLDKADYRGRYLDEVLNDIAQQSNQDLAKPARRNIGIFYHEAAGHFALWFRTMEDFAYPSPVRISNVDSDLVADPTIYASLEDEEAELTQDPEALVSRVIVVRGRAYVVRELATSEDVYGPWDVVAPNSNLRTAAAAEAYGDAELQQSSSEDETGTVRILMPAAKVNDAREFQQIRIRQSHWPGWETERWARIVHRDIKEAEADGKPAPWLYDVGLKLTPASGPPELCSFACTPSTTWYPLGGATDYFNATPDGNIICARPGLYHPTTPAPGYIGRWYFKIFGSSGGGPGTIDYAGVPYDNQLRIILVGNGTLTVQTEHTGGTPNLQVKLFRQTIAGNFVEATFASTLIDTIAAGTLAEVTIDDAADPLCVSFVTISDTGTGSTGGKFGWSEAIWTSDGCGGGG